jgi:hypothetical protein
VGQKWIQWAVVALFAQRALSVVVVLGVGAVTGSFRVTDGLSVSEWLAFGSGMASGALALYGLIRIVQRRRVQALQALAGSAIVSLLFGQFFAFASVQFVALIGLVADLGVLGALRLALAAEHERFQHEDGYVAENPRRGLGRFL